MKLAKLPDRSPVRITFQASPEQNQALQDYADFYRATYGETATVPDLVPFMLDEFIDADRAFAKFRKARADSGGRSEDASKPGSERGRGR